MYTQAVKVKALTACCILKGCILIFPMCFKDKYLQTRTNVRIIKSWTINFFIKTIKQYIQQIQ